MCCPLGVKEIIEREAICSSDSIILYCMMKLGINDDEEFYRLIKGGKDACDKVLYGTILKKVPRDARKAVIDAFLLSCQKTFRIRCATSCAS